MGRLPATADEDHLSDTASSPTAGTRTVNIVVNDGVVDSPTATATIKVSLPAAAVDALMSQSGQQTGGLRHVGAEPVFQPEREPLGRMVGLVWQSAIRVSGKVTSLPGELHRIRLVWMRPRRADPAPVEQRVAAGGLQPAGRVRNQHFRPNSGITRSPSRRRFPELVGRAGPPGATTALPVGEVVVVVPLTASRDCVLPRASLPKPFERPAAIAALRHHSQLAALGLSSGIRQIDGQMTSSSGWRSAAC